MEMKPFTRESLRAGSVLILMLWTMLAPWPALTQSAIGAQKHHKEPGRALTHADVRANAAPNGSCGLTLPCSNSGSSIGAVFEITKSSVRGASCPRPL